MTVVNAMVLLLGIGLGAGALLLVGRLPRRRLAELGSGAQATPGGRRAECERLVDAVRQKLEQTAGMTRDEAKKTLVEQMQDEARHDAARHIRQIEGEAREEADRRAKKIVSIAIERLAGEFV